MTVGRVYRMEAAEGKGDEMEAALREVAPVIRKLPGALGIEILRDVDAPNSFLFIEKWESVEAHKNSSEHLPKDALAKLIPTMAGPPIGAYLNYLDTI